MTAPKPWEDALDRLIDCEQSDTPGLIECSLDNPCDPCSDVLTVLRYIHAITARAEKAETERDRLRGELQDIRVHGSPDWIDRQMDSMKRLSKSLDELGKELERDRALAK
jgi:hypothetical protein